MTVTHGKAYHYQNYPATTSLDPE